MLANQVNVLLAERQLSIKQVVEETGISRSAISNIVNNPSANVATETIDKLCRYLGVTPTEFFVYSEYDFELSYTEGEEFFDFGVFYHENERVYRVHIEIGNNEHFEKMGYPLVSDKYDVQIELSSADDINDDDELAAIYKHLPVIFQTQLNNLVIRTIQNSLALDNELMTIFENNIASDKPNVLFRLQWGKFGKRFNAKTKKFM